jgi:hypothetical protein
LIVFHTLRSQLLFDKDKVLRPDLSEPTWWSAHCACARARARVHLNKRYGRVLDQPAQFDMDASDSLTLDGCVLHRAPRVSFAAVVADDDLQSMAASSFSRRRARVCWTRRR